MSTRTRMLPLAVLVEVAGMWGKGSRSAPPQSARGKRTDSLLTRRFRLAVQEGGQVGRGRDPGRGALPQRGPGASALGATRAEDFHGANAHLELRRPTNRARCSRQARSIRFEGIFGGLLRGDEADRSSLAGAKERGEEGTPTLALAGYGFRVRGGTFLSESALGPKLERTRQAARSRRRKTCWGTRRGRVTREFNRR